MLHVSGWKDGDLKVSMATPGLHLGINAAAAVAVAVALGLSPEEWPKTAEALGRYVLYLSSLSWWAKKNRRTVYTAQTYVYFLWVPCLSDCFA